MAAKKLLTAGNMFKRTDGRWNGVVWYLDEQASVTPSTYAVNP